MTLTARYELILCLRDARRLRRELPSYAINTHRGIARRIQSLRNALKTA